MLSLLAHLARAEAGARRVDRVVLRSERSAPPGVRRQQGELGRTSSSLSPIRADPPLIEKAGRQGRKTGSARTRKSSMKAGILPMNPSRVPGVRPESTQSLTGRCGRSTTPSGRSIIPPIVAAARSLFPAKLQRLVEMSREVLLGEDEQSNRRSSLRLFPEPGHPPGGDLPQAAGAGGEAQSPGDGGRRSRSGQRHVPVRRAGRPDPRARHVGPA